MSNFIETRDVLGGADNKVCMDKRVWDAVSCELSEYLGKDIKDISYEFWMSKEELDRKEQLAIENNPHKEKIEDYYRNTGKYLYECACWESYKSKQREFKKILLLLRKMGVKNALDFGGGIGGFVKYLNRRGIRCDYLDVKGGTSHFAEWRFQKDGFKIKLLHDLDESLRSYYEAVISDNVFEHLFDLEDAVKKINRSLCPGGILVARSTFGGGGAHLKKNDKYGRFEEYDKLMAVSGFKYLGQLKEDFLTKEINKVVKNYFMLGVIIRKNRKYGGNFLIHQKVSNL